MNVFEDESALKKLSVLRAQHAAPKHQFSVCPPFHFLLVVPHKKENEKLKFGDVTVASMRNESLRPGTGNILQSNKKLVL